MIRETLLALSDHPESFFREKYKTALHLENGI